MLIVYRTNPGFEGKIVTLDKTTSAAEMDAWIDREATQGRQEIAYLEVDVELLDQSVLAGLSAHKEDYSVRDGALCLGDAPVDAGYNIPVEAEAKASAIEQRRADNAVAAEAKAKIAPTPGVQQLKVG